MSASPTELSDGKMNKAVFIWLQPMPLNQESDGSHDQSQMSGKIVPDAMSHTVDMADADQHGVDRLHSHPDIPDTQDTNFHVERIAPASIKGRVSQDDHRTIESSNQGLERGIIHLDRSTIPVHHCLPPVQDNARFAAPNPTRIRLALFADLMGRVCTIISHVLPHSSTRFFTDLTGTAALPDRVQQPGATGIGHPQHREVG